MLWINCDCVFGVLATIDLLMELNDEKTKETQNLKIIRESILTEEKGKFNELVDKMFHQPRLQLPTSDNRGEECNAWLKDQEVDTP